MYFDMHLQTEKETLRSVCFSAEKHTNFKAKFEASSPVKISNYHLKRNSRTQEMEVHINKRTRMEDAGNNEMDFDFKPEVGPQNETFVDIATVIDNKANGKVSVAGKVVFHGPSETILTKGKLLKKQEASLTDHTGSIRLVLWENDISKISTMFAYKLSKVIVRVYNDKKYLTLNKETVISESDEVFHREDECTNDKKFQNVHCPADGVKSLQRFLSCSKCKTKVVPLPEKKIVKCSEYGLTQLKTKCRSRFYATVEFGCTSDDTISLILFEEKLQKLYEIFKTQADWPKAFEVLDDDDIMEMMLTVNSTILFNEKKNVVAIEAKND